MAPNGLISLNTAFNSTPFNSFVPLEEMPPLLRMFIDSATVDDYTQLREELARNPSALEDMLCEDNISSDYMISRSVTQLSNFICETLFTNDNAECLQLLLDAGLSPDTMVIEPGFVSSSSMPILYAAVKKDAEQCVEVLLESGASPDAEKVENTVNGFGQKASVTSTALNSALERGNTEIVDLLLMYGAKAYPDSIYTAYAIVSCNSYEMLKKIEDNTEWNIDGVNWFEAMISKAGIEKYVKPFSADDYLSGMFFVFEGCIEKLYRNNLLMDFLISNNYITTEFINNTMHEAPTQSHGVTMVDGLNQLAEADLLNGIDDYAAQLICAEVIKARSYSKLVFCYEVSPKLEEFMKSVKVESDDFE